MAPDARAHLHSAAHSVVHAVSQMHAARALYAATPDEYVLPQFWMHVLSPLQLPMQFVRLTHALLFAHAVNCDLHVPVCAAV